MNAGRHGEDPYTLRLLELDEALAAGASATLGPCSGDGPFDARLAKGLACVQALQKLRPARDLRSASIDQTSEALTPEAPRSEGGFRPGMRFGRFEIRRELGRGGYGVVFLAFDPTLRREIALKVPHATALVSAHLRERFEQEARAAAGLDHPNIVKVHEAGAVGPLAYIAYAYGPGVTLAEWLKRQERPLPPRDAAVLVAALADGVAHAHGRGVWHRDLKPANILLGAERGVRSAELDARPAASSLPTSHFAFRTPKITDFGLAKIVDEDELATRSGTILGTPAYMAPEQAAGKTKQVGPAADIHALGVLLFEALTGRPPFRGDSDVETLVLVRMAEPISPSELRPGVPRDLEVICLKCLRKEPEKRYPTAAALASDLRRFLDGRPILARPVRFAEKAWRWCRKRPVVAGLAAALLLAVVAGIGGVLWQADRAVAERNQALAQRQETLRFFQKSHEVVKRLTAHSEELLKEPATEEKGRELLQEALEYYQDLIREPHTTPLIRRETAALAYRLALLQQAIGRPADAEASFLASRRLYEALHAEEPRSPPVLYDLSLVQIRHGHLLRGQRRPREALASYHAAIDSSRRLAEFDDHPTRARMMEAVTLTNVAGLEKDLGRLPEAIAIAERAVAMQREVIALDSKSEVYRSDLALGLEGLGQIYWEAKRRQETLEKMEQALAIRAEVSAANPESLSRLDDLGRSWGSLAIAQATTGHREDAERSLRRALEIFERLVAQRPSRPAYLSSCAFYRNRLARLCALVGRWDEARGQHLQAVAERMRLHRKFPGLVSAGAGLALMQLEVAEFLRKQGDAAAAEEQWASAAGTVAALPAAEPRRAEAEASLWAGAAALGRHFAARQQWQKAAETLEKALQNPAASDAQPPAELIAARWLFAECLLRNGRHDDALRETRAVRRLQEAAGTAAAQRPAAREARAAFAEALTRDRSHDADALPLLALSLADEPQRRQLLLALSWLRATTALPGERNLPEARELAERLLQRLPDDADGWRLLGRIELLAGRPASAKSAFAQVFYLTEAADAEASAWLRLLP